MTQMLFEIKFLVQFEMAPLMAMFFNSELCKKPPPRAFQVWRDIKYGSLVGFYSTTTMNLVQVSSLCFEKPR